MATPELVKDVSKRVGIFHRGNIKLVVVFADAIRSFLGVTEATDGDVDIWNLPSIVFSLYNGANITKTSRHPDRQLLSSTAVGPLSNGSEDVNI